MKYIKSVAKILVTTYLGLLVSMYFFQDHMLFHPENTDITKCPGANLLNVKYSKVTDKNFEYRFLSKNNNSKTHLIIYHGNATSVCNRLDFVSKLEKLNLNIYLFEYPGFGNHEGKINEKNILANSYGFYTYIKEMFPNDKFYLYGESLGTGVATYIAAKDNTISKLFLQSPYTSISDIGQDSYPVIPVKLLLNNHFEMKEIAPLVKAKVTMFYGGKDLVIPNKISLEEYSRFTSEKNKYYYPNQPHAMRYQNKMFWSDFISELKN